MEVTETDAHSRIASLSRHAGIAWMLCVLAWAVSTAGHAAETTVVPPTGAARIAAEASEDEFAAMAGIRHALINTTQSIVIRVTEPSGNPSPNVDVTPLAVLAPEGVEHPLEFTPPVGRTDHFGRAHFQVRIGAKPGKYEALLFIGSEADPSASHARIEFLAQTENWATILLLTLAGGLAIFLYGMKTASDGLQAIAGNRLRNALGGLTRNQFMALLLGIAVTFFTQSSGATTVMVMSFIRAKLLTFRNSLAIILGAAIAGTITVQLISFDLFVYALPAIALGFGFYFFSGREKVKAGGLIALGFGFVFLGMNIMTEQMAPLKSFPAFRGAVAGLAGHPVWAVLLSTLFTAATQSSGAVLGVVLAFARQDLVTLEHAIPMFFGAAIGATITGLLAAVGAPAEAKRIAWGHLVFKVGAVMLFLPLLPQLAEAGRMLSAFLAGGTPASGEGVARTIANTYTLFVVVAALLAFPLLPLIEKLVTRWIPDTPESTNGEFRSKYLDPTVLDTPSVALGSVRREISRMGRFVEEMMRSAAAGLFDKESGAAAFIHARDNKVDFLNAEITHYLNQLNKHVQDTEESAGVIDMLYVVSDLESIGDIFDKNLVPLTEKMLGRGYSFSEEGEKDLRQLQHKVAERLSEMVIALATGDRAIAEKIISGFEALQAEGKHMHLRHIRRLQSELPESVETSSVHLDVINYLMRIDYLVFNICLHISGKARQSVMLDAT